MQIPLDKLEPAEFSSSEEDILKVGESDSEEDDEVIEGYKAQLRKIRAKTFKQKHGSDLEDSSDGIFFYYTMNMLLRVGAKLKNLYIINKISFQRKMTKPGGKNDNNSMVGMYLMRRTRRCQMKMMTQQQSWKKKKLYQFRRKLQRKWMKMISFPKYLKTRK